MPTDFNDMLHFKEPFSNGMAFASTVVNATLSTSTPLQGGDRCGRRQGARAVGRLCFAHTQLARIGKVKTRRDSRKD